MSADLAPESTTPPTTEVNGEVTQPLPKPPQPQKVIRPNGRMTHVMFDMTRIYFSLYRTGGQFAIRYLAVLQAIQKELGVFGKTSAKLWTTHDTRMEPQTEYIEHVRQVLNADLFSVSPDQALVTMPASDRSIYTLSNFSTDIAVAATRVSAIGKEDVVVVTDHFGVYGTLQDLGERGDSKIHLAFFPDLLDCRWMPVINKPKSQRKIGFVDLTPYRHLILAPKKKGENDTTGMRNTAAMLNNLP